MGSTTTLRAAPASAASASASVPSVSVASASVVSALFSAVLSVEAHPPKSAAAITITAAVLKNFFISFVLLKLYFA